MALAAKALATFRRETDLLSFKGGVMGGDPLTAEQLEALSRLPARDVLHGQLVGIIASPITGLVRTLNALISGLAIQLGQIAEQGLVGGDAPAGGGPGGGGPGRGGGELPPRKRAEVRRRLRPRKPPRRLRPRKPLPRRLAPEEAPAEEAEEPAAEAAEEPAADAAGDESETTDAPSEGDAKE